MTCISHHCRRNFTHFPVLWKNVLCSAHKTDPSYCAVNFLKKCYFHCLIESQRRWKLMQMEALITHWGRVTHICVSNLTINGSDNGLSPGRRQAIIWTNAGILLIGPLGTNFNEIFIEINTFSFKKIHLKMSSAKWRPFFSASMC